ncbi:MAG: murein L,D-transpeptidase catalytic domain family protein [Syntrophobacteraceae bacterium]|nr:murein L,D-transpeptidase catalytic domain family protein [Desulfobacteraceae bacterium]
MGGFDSHQTDPCDGDFLFPAGSPGDPERKLPSASGGRRPPHSIAKAGTNRIGRVLGCATLILCLLFPTPLVEESCPLSSRHYPIFTGEARQVIASTAFVKAFRYFSAHKRLIHNRKYLTVIDYTKPSHVKRMYLLNRETCEVQSFLVAHGKQSGFSFASRFSNEFDSHMSSKGFFLTGRTYVGIHGLSLLLHGLEKNVNDNALRRGIVIHGAEYVSRRSVLVNRGRLGRSFGCPAVPAPEACTIIHKLKNGSLLYIHAGD